MMTKTTKMMTCHRKWCFEHRKWCFAIENDEKTITYDDFKQFSMILLYSYLIKTTRSVSEIW